MENAWIILSQNEYDKVWDSFYEKFKFCPSIHSENFPSILEPNPSVTYEISKEFDDDEKITDVDNKVLSALRSQTFHNEKIYVLDWQHECYCFYPHRKFDKWLIPILPNGDYSIFLAEDFHFGIFGHPWEWTSCIWGVELLPFFEKSKPELWQRKIRQKS